MELSNITRRDFLKVCGTAAGAAMIGFSFQCVPAAYAAESSFKDYMSARIAGVYAADGRFGVRSSMDNLQVGALYRDWLGEPGSHKAHELLHMKFKDKSENVRRLGAGAVNPRAGEFEGGSYPFES